MSYLFRSCVALCLALFTSLALAAPGIGDPAPEFTLMGSDGVSHSLADYKGRQAVVIAFFPKAFTGG